MAKTPFNNKNARTIVVNKNRTIDVTNVTNIEYWRIADNEYNITDVVAICIQQNLSGYMFSVSFESYEDFSKKWENGDPCIEITTI